MIDKNLHKFFQKGFLHLDSFVETGLGPYHSGLKYCFLGTIFDHHKGTYPAAHGDFGKHVFTHFVSIEVHQDYIDKANRLWRSVRPDQSDPMPWETKVNSLENFRIVKGDSGEALENILSELNRPSIIYLDAHAHFFENDNHDDSPLRKELEAIKRHITKSGQKEYLIIVDDAGHIAYSTNKEDWATRAGTVDEIKKTLHNIFEDPDETVVVDIDYAENIVEKKKFSKHQPHAFAPGGKRNFHLCAYLKGTYKEAKQ